MSDSKITLTATGAVVYSGPAAVELYRVRALRVAIKMHRDTGIIPNRRMTISSMLAAWLDANSKNVPVEGA